MRHRQWLLLLVLTCAGCAFWQPAPLDPARLADLPERHEISATPFFPQNDYHCGPASLAMVLNYHGHVRAPEQLAPWVFTPDALGSFPAEMTALARREGFVAYPVDNLEDLLREIAVGHPVLVLQNLGTDWYTRWHFAVAVGYDLTTQTLILRSGDLPRRLTPIKLFETTWARSGHWARVILPPSALPATADALRYLQAVADLEQTGPASAASNAYDTALQQWPDQPLALFGKANIALRDGQPTVATDLLTRLLVQQPDLASGWNNLAYGLMASGCRDAAIASIECAIRLAPHSPALLESRTELVQSPVVRATCPIRDAQLPNCPK